MVSVGATMGAQLMLLVNAPIERLLRCRGHWAGRQQALTMWRASPSQRKMDKQGFGQAATP